MRRRRYQKGSLQARRHGKKRVWVVQYYDAEGHHRYHTLGRDGRVDQESGRSRTSGVHERPSTVATAKPRIAAPSAGERVRQPGVTAVPAGKVEGFHEGHVREPNSVPHRWGSWEPRGWKASRRRRLQAFLDQKAVTTAFSAGGSSSLGFKFDLRVGGCGKGDCQRIRRRRLYTPTNAKKGACPAMTAAEVEKALSAVKFRERVILHLAIFSGLRPGEILALQRRNVAR